MSMFGSSWKEENDEDNNYGSGLFRHWKEDSSDNLVYSTLQYSESDKRHLQFIYDRMILKGENANIDYMIKFKQIINK